MGRDEHADDWDNWEEPGAAHAARPQAPHAPGRRVRDGMVSDSSEEGSTEWTWNLKQMEEDLLHLPPLRSSEVMPSSTNDSTSSSVAFADGGADVDGGADETVLLEKIIAVAQETAQNIQEGRDVVVKLEALALVTKSHLLSLRKGFNIELQQGDADLEVPMIIERLHKIAGDWGVANHVSDAIPQDELQSIREASSLLHRSLSSCAGDLTPFQQVLEQVFASLPRHTLTIPVTWIRPTEKQRGSTDNTAAAAAALENVDPFLNPSPYLQHVLDLSDPVAAPERVVSVLTEAEVFQDSKDIKRDELIVNGAFVPGTVGYNAIVDSVQHRIHEILPAQVIGKQHVEATTREIAKQILNACNRTESGGSSYEILGKFLSNHDMAAILIRPDSAKAAPLEIQLDLGAYLESANPEEQPPQVWAFGVRAVLSAVTWYLVCDADDPTNELYEVKTTYRNRMAFPLGLTPFHPLNSMRKDHGEVQIQVMLPNQSESLLPTKTPGDAEATAYDHHSSQDDDAGEQHGDQDADFDELL